MKHIKIIHYYLGIVDGVFTTLIDLYRNLNELNQDVSFEIIIPPWFDIKLKNFKVSLLPSGKVSINLDFMRNNENFGGYDLFECFTEDLNHTSDIIITSIRSLYEISQGVPLSLNSDRFIVLDTLDSTRIKLGQFENLDKYITCNDTYFMSNPSNMGITKYKEIEYYHKLNRVRLNHMQHWNQNSFYYCRKDRYKALIKNDCYAENIGKVIFEYLYLNKKVIYDPDGMFMNDGLFYYLKLFDVDANKKQDLIISKQQICDTLLMYKEDILLNLL